MKEVNAGYLSEVTSRNQKRIRDVVDASGTRRKHVGYDSFGQLTGEAYSDANGDPIVNPATHAEAIDQLFYFAGQQRDEATGLQQNRARWYDPIAADPNLYRYASNNPVTNTDPTGLRTLKPYDTLPALSKPATSQPTVDPLLQQFNQFAFNQNLQRNIFNPPAQSQFFGPTRAEIERAGRDQLSRELNRIHVGADLGGFINDPVIAALGNPRVQSGLTVAQGVGEAAVGAGLLFAPEPTGLTKAGAGVLFAKSVDSLQAGGRGLFSGDFVPTVTHSAVQSTAQFVGLPQGESSFIAGVVDAGPLVIGGFGTAAARGSGSALATSVDDFAAGSSLSPAVQRGSLFNRLRQPKYEFNEIYVEGVGGRRYILDSYNLKAGEIVSRKGTQFAEVNVKTGVQYVQEAARKYSPGAKIARVPTSGGLAGKRLEGRLYLEVPIQGRPIPKKVLDTAARNRVIIRDVTGREY